MKKLSILLALLLLVTGCSSNAGISQAPEATTAAAVQETGNENQLVTVDIYAVNDLHGKLADTDAQPGVDELSTYLKQAQQAGNTILLATGDMWQGASESNLTDGLIVTDWMNEMDFTALTVGGHEFDWGEEPLRQNVELAEFPFLSINIYNRETDQPLEYCETSIMVDVDGVQIGIIGAIGDIYNSIATEHSKNIYFKVGDELTELVKAESEKLRSEGADFIIYTMHAGYDKTNVVTKSKSVSDWELEEYYDVVLSEGYVDIVFEADSHFTYVLTDREGVYHLQAGGNNKGISHASVLFNKANGDVLIYNAELVMANQYTQLEDDPVVEQLLEKYDEQIAPSTRLLGNNSQYRSGDDICQIVADLYASLGEETWGEEYDIVLGGGFISCRSPGYLPAGEVSYSHLLALLPFDNQITLCSIQGRDLISKFLESTHYAYFIKTTDYGESIRNRIDPDATYYVVTDSYSAYYAPNNMTVIDTYDDGIFARDLMADYISAGGMQ